MQLFQHSRRSKFLVKAVLPICLMLLVFPSQARMIGVDGDRTEPSAFLEQPKAIPAHQLKTIRKLGDGSLILDFEGEESEIIYQRSLVPFSYDTSMASLILDFQTSIFPEGFFYMAHDRMALRASTYGDPARQIVRVVLEGNLKALQGLKVSRSPNQITLIPQDLPGSFHLATEDQTKADDQIDLTYDQLNEQLDRNYPQDRVLPLSLKEAVIEVLNRNIDIQILQDGQKARRLEAAYNWGVYAPTIGTESFFRDERVPVASVLAGGVSGAIETKSFVNSNFLRGKLPTGTSYDFSFENKRTRTDNVFQQLIPEYESSLNFSITQALLRNAWIDQDRQNIQVAKVNATLATYDLEDQIQQSVYLAEQAYWELALARVRVLIREQAVELALEQLHRINQGYEIGAVARVEAISAEAELQRRKDDLLLSQQLLFASDAKLKLLLADGMQSAIWKGKISPSDELIPLPAQYDLETILTQASAERPVFQKLKSQLKIKDIEWNYLFNQGFPQLDITAQYSLLGLAGTDSTASNPFGGGSVPPIFSGGYFKNLSNLFSNDFRAAQIGFKFSWPISPQNTKKVLNRVDLEKHQLRLQITQQIQAVQVEILNAFQAVSIGKQRIEASKAALIDADKQLKAEQEKFRIGLSTNFLVLTRQNDLSSSQERLATVIADYNKSLADLKKAAGINLKDYRITITNKSAL